MIGGALHPIFLRVIAAALLAAGCVGPVQGLYPPGEGDAVRSVWVVNHGNVMYQAAAFCGGSRSEVR